MTGTVDPIPEEALEQATAWLYQIEAAPQDVRLREALRRWIGEDEAHARAWLLTTKAWQLAGQARPAFAPAFAPAFSSDWATETVAPAQRHARPWGERFSFASARRRRVAAGMAAAALAACLALFMVLPDMRTWIAADFATATGETRQISLEDGSLVHLGADSAIVADFTAERRALALLRGEAFFQVVTDPARPFVVQADDLSVTVTGTAFDVAVTERSFSVAVASGAVRVAPPRQAEIVLSGGQRMTVDRHSGAVTPGETEVWQVAAWRDGRLVVEDAAFADVVEAIGRYHSGAIVIAKDALDGRHVTGVYDLQQPLRALRALAGPYGGVVREVTPYLLVVTGF